MKDGTGFRVTRHVIEDDNVIEIESIASESSDLDELLATFDELRAELDETRTAHQKLHEVNVRLRDELAAAEADNRTLRVEIGLWKMGIAESEAGRRFVPDGRGGEIEVTTYADLTRPQGEE